MNKRKLIKVAVLALVCAGIWLYRYFSFNAEIAKTYTPKRIYYTVDETVEYENNIVNLHTYNGCGMKLKKAQLLSMEDFCCQFGLLQTYSVMQEENDIVIDSKICLLELEFINGSNRSLVFDLSDLVLCGREKVLNLSTFVIEINPELNLEENNALQPEPGSSQTVLMPFLLTREGFTAKEWAQIEYYPLYLFVTQFPEERVICISYT